MAAGDSGAAAEALSWSETVDSASAVMANQDEAGNTRAADTFRRFYRRNPGRPEAVEARKLEAMLLIEAARETRDSALKTRMRTTAQAFRRDATVPARERAVVAGTLDFADAAQRVHGPADLLREYTAVARGLIQEFPNQPQGYVSLLTEAQQNDDATASAMAAEVANAPAAPAEVRTQARRLLTRLSLVGQPVRPVLGLESATDGAGSSWRADRPGLVYFWASWSPDSLVLADQLAAASGLADANVIGICLDPDPEAAAAAAAEHRLPGRLLYPPAGVNSDLAAQLGADAAPLVYLIDRNGRITDVHGLDGLEAKRAALGF